MTGMCSHVKGMTMKRVVWPVVACVVLVVVLLAAGAALLDRPVVAEDRTLAMTVRFDYSGPEGEPCGYIFGMPGYGYPLAAQVTVMNADGIVVGTLDLRDGLDYTFADETLPGIISGNDCVVEGELGVPDSAYYTFTIEGTYRWTADRSDLEAHDWTVPIDFVPAT